MMILDTNHIARPDIKSTLAHKNRTCRKRKQEYYWFQWQIWLDLRSQKLCFFPNRRLSAYGGLHTRMFIYYVRIECYVSDASLIIISVPSIAQVCACWDDILWMGDITWIAPHNARILYMLDRLVMSIYSYYCRLYTLNSDKNSMHFRTSCGERHTLFRDWM